MSPRPELWDIMGPWDRRGWNKRGVIWMTYDLYGWYGLYDLIIFNYMTYMTSLTGENEWTKLYIDTHARLTPANIYDIYIYIYAQMSGIHMPYAFMDERRQPMEKTASDLQLHEEGYCQDIPAWIWQRWLGLRDSNILWPPAIWNHKSNSNLNYQFTKFHHSPSQTG